MQTKKINLIAADMGYGHQRAAYPLLDLSGGEIITANNYVGIPEWEKKYWINSLRSYERISRFKKVPLLGSLVFKIMDNFQKIKSFYPSRDLSSQTTQQKFFLRSIKAGLGKDLIEKLNPSGLPFLTTFFVAAYMAEYHNYAGDIYCLVCDADASRAWAPIDPKNSRVKYLLPSEKVKERFLMYGVKESNIIISGFPLPKENIGAEKEILEIDLASRVKALDPRGEYQETYAALLNKVLPNFSGAEKKAITLSFAVGGAGAQKEIAGVILRKLAAKIKANEININLVAGNRPEIRDYFLEQIKLYTLQEGNGVRIIFAAEKNDYFKKFNDSLHNTDILWTKPSELSFYCALGLPVIMSAPVGSQEDYNREWLMSVGAGVDSLDAEYVDEWLPDLLESGRLARAAMDGFLNAEQMGTYNIEKIILES
ncbi:MAG: hypothetical protein WCN88_02775 [Candidatus Falkowbacteria bacterium]